MGAAALKSVFPAAACAQPGLGGVRRATPPGPWSMPSPRLLRGWRVIGVTGSVLRFMDELEDNDDVQNVYSNMDVDDAILSEMED